MKKIKKRLKKNSGKTPLELAWEKKRQQKEDGIIVKSKNPREAWEDGKQKSLRKSINAKCFDCCGEELYRNRIKFCNIIDCELWHVRPYSKGITKDQCLEYTEG